MEQTLAPATGAELDGRHDFDFLFGSWRVSNRKLVDPLGAGPPEWIEFAAELRARPILGGLGNIDEYLAPALPGRGHYEGFTLRLFDPETHLWRIWFTSTIGPRETLEPPVVGRFVEGRGSFESDEVLGGRPTRVRYLWLHGGEPEAHWEQAFSWDGGETWNVNWLMDYTRTG